MPEDTKESLPNEKIEEILIENGQLTETNKELKETADKVLEENEKLKKTNNELNTNLGDTLKKLAVANKIVDQRNSIKTETKKIGVDLKAKIEPKKSRVASSQTKPAKKVAKGNQTKPEPLVRRINRNVQTIWTSDRIERVKDELKKVKDQIKSDELAKLRDEMRKDHFEPKKEALPEEEVIDGLPEEIQSPTRQTMKSTSHEALVEKQVTGTPSILSTDDDLDEKDDVFEEKKVTPIDEMLEEIQTLKKENQQLRTASASNDDELDLAQKQLQKAKVQIQTLEDDNHELEEQNEELVEQNKKISEQLDEGPIDEETGRPVTKAVLLKEIRDLRQINDDLNEEIRVQDQQIVKLESDLQQQHDAESSDSSDVFTNTGKAALRNKIQDLSEENQNLLASNERLEDELVETKSKLKNEQRNNEMNEKHILAQQDDNDELAERNKHLETELQNKNDQLEQALLSKESDQLLTLAKTL